MLKSNNMRNEESMCEFKVKNMRRMQKWWQAMKSSCFVILFNIKITNFYLIWFQYSELILFNIYNSFYPVSVYLI